jgi:hypothetical protein
LITFISVGHITVEIATTTFKHAFRILIVDTRLDESHKIPPFKKRAVNKKPVAIISHGLNKLLSAFLQKVASATRPSQKFGTRGFPPPDYSKFGFIGYLN